MEMEDTIAAISTSTVSSGGISIVRISGPDAIIIGDKVFKSKKNIKLANVKSHTVHFGNICDNDNEIDEALVIVMKAPNTYTRENIVEIDCHGGILVTKKVLGLQSLVNLQREHFLMEELIFHKQKLLLILLMQRMTTH